MSVQEEDSGEEVVEVAEEEAPEKPELSDVERLASDMGWSPQDQWRGDADKWVDATAYIKAGPEILKSSLKRQDSKMLALEGTLKEFKGHYEKVTQTAYDRAMADLKQQQREAVAEGDTEAFERVETQIETLNAPEAKAEPDANPDNDPAFIQFQAKNDWYGPDGDYEMTAEAEKAAAVIGRSYEGEEFYTRITNAMKKKFPDRFGNPARKETARVEGSGGNAPRKSGGKTFSDLPAEGKAACNKFVAEGLMTKEDYVRDYFEDES